MTFDGPAPSAWVNEDFPGYIFFEWMNAGGDRGGIEFDGGEIWWYLHPFGRLFPLEIVQLDSLEQAIPKLRELFGQ